MSNCSSVDGCCARLQSLVASSKAELAVGEVLLVWLAADFDPLVLEDITCDLPGFVVAYGQDLAGNPAKHAVPVEKVTYKDSRISVLNEENPSSNSMGFVV